MEVKEGLFEEVDTSAVIRDSLLGDGSDGRGESASSIINLYSPPKRVQGNMEEPCRCG